MSKEVTFKVSSGKKGEADFVEGEFKHEAPESLEELILLTSEKEAYEHAYRGWAIAVQAADRNTLKGKEAGVLSIGKATKEAIASGKLSASAIAELEAILGRPLQ